MPPVRRRHIDILEAATAANAHSQTHIQYIWSIVSTKDKSSKIRAAHYSRHHWEGSLAG